MNLMNLLITPLREFYDLSQFQIELVTSLLLIGVGFGSLSSEMFTSSFGRVNTLFVSLFTLLISHTMMAISIDIYMFILFRIIIGFSLGLILPISLNLYGQEDFLCYLHGSFLHLDLCL